MSIRRMMMLPTDDVFLSDLTTNIKAAYSLRVVVRGYTGPLVRLRRRVDDVERDFFAGGNNQIIQSEVIEWEGGGDSVVVVIYDQAGNADGVQTTKLLQPFMSTAGVFETTVSNRPTINYSADRRIEFPANFAIEGIGARGMSAYIDPIGTPGVSTSFGQFNSGAGANFSIGVSTNEVRARFNGCNRGLTGLTLTDVVVGLHSGFNTFTNDCIITLDSSSESHVLINGSDVVINTPFATTGSVGLPVTSQSTYLGYKCSEMIFYDTLLPPAERIAVESEMVTYWKG